jgi:hypothetical protein
MKLDEELTVMIYLGLLNSLIDHIEGDFRQSIFNKQSLKNKSNMVLDELLKIEQQLYKNNPDTTVSDDYFSAGKNMLEFFKLGIKMTKLEQADAQSLNNELNSLLNKYELDLEFTK